MQQICRNGRAQSSVFDATMCLAIMLVASSLLINLSYSVLEVNDVQSFEDMFSYTGRLARAGLMSTVPNASYLDIDGREIMRRDISVQDMVIEELLLLQSGVPEQNLGGAGRYSDRIGEVFSDLTNGSPYSYALHGKYLDVEIHITSSDSFSNDSQGRTERATYVSVIFLPENDETIIITLQVWRK